jgi:hypothetical protein
LSKEVNERILQATTRGLERMGKNVSTVCYWKFKQEVGMDASKIPSRPEEFSRCVSSLFGPGYPIIEASIVTELQQEFEINSIHTKSYQELVKKIREDALKDSL